MVEIDQQDLTCPERIRDPVALARQIYAPLVEFCARAGSKGVCLRHPFSEPSSYGKEDDLTLASGDPSGPVRVPSMGLDFQIKRRAGCFVPVPFRG